MSVYFLLHVPKTAGITIAEHLAENCPRGMLWRPQQSHFFARREPLPDFDRVRAVAMGHYRGRSLERHFPGREIRRAVLLREPVSLQVSYYNWRMMYFLSRGQRTYSFDLHLRTLPRNFVTHFLLHRWLEIPRPLLMSMPDARKFELLQQHLSRFWFVGAHTDCERLIAAIALDLGIPGAATPRNTIGEWRSFVDWRPLQADELSPNLRNAVLANNPLDRILWETWHTAGFDAPRVRFAALARNKSSNAFRREMQRYPLELVRLWRCGRARLPDIAARGLPAISDTKPVWQPRHGVTAESFVEELSRAPENADIWRAYLTLFRHEQKKLSLPRNLIGLPEDMGDAGLCMLKAEFLLCCRHYDDARRFLRFGPSLARNRLQARDITLRAAALDSEFGLLVRRADRARNRRNWQDSTRLYRAALDLYPGHCGYMVQYAHCLKEMRDYTAAEIYYRSARALGAPLQDMQEELILVAAHLNYEEPVKDAAAWRPSANSATLLDDPPTRADIDIASYVTADTILNDLDHMVRILRATKTIRDLLHGMIKDRHPDATEDQFATLMVDASSQFIQVRRRLAISLTGKERKKERVHGYIGGPGLQFGSAPSLV